MTKKDEVWHHDPRRVTIPVGDSICTLSYFCNFENIYLEIIDEKRKVIHTEALSQGTHTMTFRLSSTSEICYIRPSERVIVVHSVSFKALPLVSQGPGTLKLPIPWSRKTVLFITGTACSRAEKEAVSLRKRGYAVYLLCTEMAPYVSPFSFDGVMEYKDEKSLREALTRIQPKIVHVHNKPSWPAIVSSQMGIKTVLDVHDYVRPSEDPSHLVEACKSVDAVITVSKGLANILERETGKKVGVVETGAFPSLVSDEGTERFQDGKVHVVYIGSLYDRDYAVRWKEKMCKFLSKYENVVLHLHAAYFRDVFTPDTGHERLVLEDACKAKDVQHVLRQYDIGLRTVHYQGRWVMPNKLMEYIAAGLPVLVERPNPEMLEKFGDWIIPFDEWDGSVPSPQTEVHVSMDDMINGVVSVYDTLIPPQRLEAMRPLKFVYLSWDNTARIPYAVHVALKRMGIESSLVIGVRNYLNYPGTYIDNLSLEDVVHAVNDSDVVLLNAAQSRNYYEFPLGDGRVKIDIPSDKVVVRFGHGTIERRQGVPGGFNLSVVTTPDLDPDGESIWIPGPVELIPELAFAHKFQTDPILISHSPTRRNIKGTDEFLDAVRRLRLEGYNVEVLLIERKPHLEALRERRRAFIHFDQYPLGVYGISAVEGLLMGQHVLVGIDDKWIPVYEDRCGELPFQIIRHGDVYSALKDLLDHLDEYEWRRFYGRSWAIRNHSSEVVVGEMLRYLSLSL